MRSDECESRAYCSLAEESLRFWQYQPIELANTDGRTSMGKQHEDSRNPEIRVRRGGSWGCKLLLIAAVKRCNPPSQFSLATMLQAKLRAVSGRLVREQASSRILRSSSD